MMHKPLISADLIVIDGDRGKNYPKQEDFMTSGHCIFLNATNVTKNGFDFSECIFISEEKNNILGKGIVKANDIVLTTRGTVGNSGFYSEIIAKNFSACRINSGMVILRCNSEKLNPYFVYIFIKSDLFLSQVDALRSGSAQPQLPIRDIKQITIPDLPLQKQHGIASILGSIDDKIDLNRRTNETLEAMARALFRDWFVDFGPTRAKMAGEAPYLAPELWELFPDRLDDEGKPEGWHIASIDFLCRITSGKRPPNKETSPSDENPIPVYGGNGISWFTKDILFDQAFLITGRVGTLGTVFRVNEKCWVSDNALCLFPKIDSYFEYLYFIISGIDFQILNSGSTQPLLTQSSISSQECILPAEEIIRIFHAQVSVWFEKQQQLEKESHILAQLRDLILPKLISGEISIREAEKMVEDVA